MPTVVSFTKRLPPAAAGSASRGTLAELMAQQKAAAEAKSSSMQMETPTIAQGFGKLAQTLSSGLQERWRGQELAAGQKALGGIVGSVDPLQGATPEQIAQAGQYDPEVMKSLLADRVERQRTLADADNWQPATPEEKAALGAAPDDPIMRNKHNGEFKSLASGGNTTISTGDKIETEYGKQLAKGFVETINADRTAGKEGAIKIAQMEALNPLMQEGYTGTEALISEYVRKNFGINLGPKADATAAFGAIIDNMVPKQRVEGSGTTSNFDAQMFKNSLPDLLKSPQANRLIMGYIKGLAARDQEVAKIAEQAGQIEDPRAARKFYYDGVSKLGNPLANLQKDVEAIRKQKEAGGGTGAPAADAGAPGKPAEGETIINPNPVEGATWGGIKSQRDNGDGTITITFHNGRTSVQRLGK